MKKLIAVLALVVTTSAFAQTVGDVAFANSGAPAAQDAFLRGLALLHDFEYADAADSFRAAQKIDPDFAMAYWGEAMTYNHPLWLQQDRDKAQAVLSRAPQAKTDRERAYLHAVNVLYGDGTKEERDAKYSAEMAAIHQHYPDDVDATAFYALSLLGTRAAHRDYATYMRAAALLEEVFPAHQHHPGVLHYLIHSYDDPVHAPLGMRAARLYGGVAPNAPHALHMTSHIYIALGMWDAVIEANQHAIEVARKHQPMVCGHYPNWLEYAYLQEGRLDEAREMLDRCTAAAMKDAERTGGAADMRVQYVTSGGALPAWTAPEAASANAKFTVAYADALAAAQRGDAPALNEASTRLHGLVKDLGKHDRSMVMMSASDSERPPVIIQQVEALQLAAAGKRDEAIAMLQKAVSAEQAMAFEFGPPAVEKPSLELLGDQLIAAGRAAEAEKAYRTALERTPGRTRSLEGLLAAQKSLGESEEAARTSELLQRYRAKKVAANQ
jgi:tetratricopeptide (TPR) repeat protein